MFRRIAEIARPFVALSPDQVDDHIHDVIHQVGELVGVDRVTVTQIPAGEPTVRRTHQWARPGIALMPGEDSTSPFPWLTRRILAERVPVVISRLDELPPDADKDRRSLQGFGIRSLAAFPMVVDGSAIGALSFAALERERSWPADVKDGLELVTELVASTLARKHKQVALDQTQAFERLLTELSTTFINLSPDGIDAQVMSAIGAVATLLDLDRSQVVQRTAARDGGAVTHQWVRDEAWRLPAFVPLSVMPQLFEAIVVHRQEVILSRLADASPAALGDAAFLPPALRPKSVAIFPLAVGGQVIGAVSFGAIRRERTWSPDEVARLRVVAHIIASGLARKQTQHELERVRAFEGLIAELSASFIDLSPEAVDVHIEDCIERVAHHLELDRSQLARRDPDGNFVITHQWAREEQWRIPSYIPAAAVPWITRKADAGEAVVFSRLDEGPSESEADRRFIASSGTKSTAILPISVGGQVIGGLTFGTIRAPRKWSDEEISRLRLIVEIIGSSLGRKEAQLALAQLRTFEQLVAELSASFVGLTPDAADDRIAAAIARVADVLDLDRAQVGEAGPGGIQITHQWVREERWRTPSFIPSKAVPWAMDKARDGEPIVASRLGDLPRQEREFLGRFDVKSVAMFPMVVGGQFLGGLACETIERERTWLPEVVARLRVVAEIIGSALGRKRADLELRSTLAFERLIAELSATFVNLPPGHVDDHIRIVLGHVAEFLRADRSTVWQLAAPDQRFERTHQWLRDVRESRALDVSPEASMPWTMARLRAGHQVVFSHPEELPMAAATDREYIARHGPRSLIVTPLVVGGDVIGGVAFGGLREGRGWSPDAVDRLRLVAEILASAFARQRGDLALRKAMAENEQLRQRLEQENVYLQGEIKSAHDFGDIVGRSPALRAVLHKVDQVAATDAPVLLLGETGTGKELVAHAIHARSTRADRAMITVNCAALPPSLIESELFGHEKGAFTGATHARTGRFELANGSTLFLDEIGDLDPALQAKLLRALQTGEIERLGSSRTHRVDVRIVAATNRDLDAAMAEGRFREDLYYRLAVFPIHLPPLRERREDIPLLVWHFLQSRQRTLGRSIESIPQPAMDALVASDWPGNVRELQNIVDRALILSSGPVLRLEGAFGPPRSGRARPAAEPAAPSAPEKLAEAERTHIVGVLERCEWRIEGRGQAADRLGMRPSTLRNRMRKLGIRRPASPAS